MTAQHAEIERRLRDAFTASEVITQHWQGELPPAAPARRLRWVAPAIAGAAVAAIAVPLAVLGHSGSDHRIASTLPAATVTESAPAPAPASATVVIDPSISETFVRAPASAVPRLTANSAFQRYAKLNGATLSAPPTNTTVQLGYLTLPVGGGAPPTADNELVWAYSAKDECPARSDNLNVKSNWLVPCTSWLFLDATTGKQIDWTWQK